VSTIVEHLALSKNKKGCRHKAEGFWQIRSIVPNSQ
jgi:hypothetical protein